MSTSQCVPQLLVALDAHHSRPLHPSPLEAVVQHWAAELAALLAAEQHWAAELAALLAVEQHLAAELIEPPPQVAAQAVVQRLAVAESQLCQT